MHRGAVGHARDEIVREVEENEESVHDFVSHVPIGDAVGRLPSGLSVLWGIDSQVPWIYHW